MKKKFKKQKIMLLFYKDKAPSTRPTKSPNLSAPPPLVAVVNTFNRRNCKSGSISTIIINHMVGSNPQQLMALMQIQLGKHWLVPPELLAAVAAAAAAMSGAVGGGGALAGVDLEALVRGDEGGM